MDTLRADHTTPYGYARDTTPELARFAEDAVVFEQAISHASWTKPAVASLFTSLLPGRHRAVQLRDQLDPGHVTLAEMLEAKGYATGAAIANSVIYGQGTNFEQGFDFYAGLHGEGDRPSKLVEAAGVVDAALRWLDARRGFPTFLYVHTMDPHVPYAPPAPFDRKYEPHPTPDHPAVDPRSDYKEPTDRERMIAQYDGDIAYGDQEFGRFVRELQARGLYDDALIVFLADHGEEFLDHGQWPARQERVRRADPRAADREVPRPPRRGPARRGSRCRWWTCCPPCSRARACPCRSRRTSRAGRCRAWSAGRAPEPPAVSEISHRGFVAHGMRTRRGQIRAPLQPAGGRALLRPRARPREQTNRIDGGRRPRAAR